MECIQLFDTLKTFTVGPCSPLMLAVKIQCLISLRGKVEGQVVNTNHCLTDMMNHDVIMILLMENTCTIWNV